VGGVVVVLLQKTEAKTRCVGDAEAWRRVGVSRSVQKSIGENIRTNQSGVGVC
jgi:hypothetical protein